MDWLTTSWSTLGILALKALLSYAALVVFVRIAGLRAFSKMSSFDFAVTTGDISVLHAEPGGPPVDPQILAGVRGAERLFEHA